MGKGERLRRQRGETNQGDTKQSASIEVSQAQFSGPLPPPGVLAQYDDLVPGAADRIIALAESQSAHRQSLEKIVVSGGSRAETRGQWMAFILSLLVVSGGLWLLVTDKSTAGLALILTNLVALATVFIYGRFQQQRERREKHRRFARKT